MSADPEVEALRASGDAFYARMKADREAAASPGEKVYLAWRRWRERRAARAR